MPSSRTAPKTKRQQHQPRQRRRRLTNTNTDSLCSDQGFFSKWIYRFNLWTGLYMLNPYERLAFHLVGWFSLTVSLLYIYVFWKGFVEGFQAIGDVVDENTEVAADVNALLVDSSMTVMNTTVGGEGGDLLGGNGVESDMAF